MEATVGGSISGSAADRKQIIRRWQHLDMARTQCRCHGHGHGRRLFAEVCTGATPRLDYFLP
jgi:hypothetical protein